MLKSYDKMCAPGGEAVMLVSILGFGGVILIALIGLLIKCWDVVCAFLGPLTGASFLGYWG